MGALLNVCIPIKAKSVPRRKMTFAEMVALFNAELPTLVTHMAKFAPSQGGSAGKVGLDTFTLNDLIGCYEFVGQRCLLPRPRA